MLKAKILLLMLLSFGGFSQEEIKSFERLDFKGTVYELLQPENKNDSAYTRIDTVFLTYKHENHTLGEEEKIMFLLYYVKGIKLRVTGYFDNGQKSLECYFIDGKDFNGMHTQWYKNGYKFTQTYYENGVFAMPSLSWYPNGSLQRYSDLNPETNKGVIREWYPSGKLRHESIGIDTTAEGGIFRDYFENGQVAIQFIYNFGRQSFLSYFEDGKIQTEGFIYIAVWDKVGKWTEYYKNGKRQNEKFYHDTIPNFKTGKWSYWDEKGRLIKEEIYKDNELIYVKDYLPYNKIKKN